MAEEKLDVQTAGFEIQGKDKIIRIDNSEVNIYSGDGGPLLKEVLQVVQNIRHVQKAEQKILTKIDIETSQDAALLVQIFDQIKNGITPEQAAELVARTKPIIEHLNAIGKSADVPTAPKV